MDIMNLMGKVIYLRWNMMSYMNFVKDIHKEPKKFPKVLLDLEHEIIFPKLQNQPWEGSLEQK